MDLSNTETDDFLRATSLTAALNAHASSPEGFPAEVIFQAREFYLFLTKNDPILDSPPVDGTNVIPMFGDHGFE